MQHASDAGGEEEAGLPFLPILPFCVFFSSYCSELEGKHKKDDDNSVWKKLRQLWMEVGEDDSLYSVHRLPCGKE